MVSNHSGGTSLAARASQTGSRMSTRSSSRSAASTRRAASRAPHRPAGRVAPSGDGMSSRAPGPSLDERARASGTRAYAGSGRAVTCCRSTSRVTPVRSRDLLDVEIARDRVGRRADRRQQAVERLALVIHALEPALLLQQLHLALEQVDGVRQDRLERGGAAPADERVGILAGGHRGDPDPDAVAEQLVARAEGGAEPGLVAVVEQDRRRARSGGAACAWSAVSAVPSGATTCSMPARTSRSTSK